MEIAAVDSKESKSSLHFAKRTDLEGRLDKGVRIPLTADDMYRKVASSSLSWLVAHFWVFRLFMKGKFDAYVL